MLSQLIFTPKKERGVVRTSMEESYMPVTKGYTTIIFPMPDKLPRKLESPELPNFPNWLDQFDQ